MYDVKFCSLLSNLSEKELGLVDKFIDKVINQEKMINEIQKMIFDKHFYVRFLKGHNFDLSVATMQLKNYIQWRKKQNIETILVSTPFNLIPDRTSISANMTKLRSFSQMGSTIQIKKGDQL